MTARFQEAPRRVPFSLRLLSIFNPGVQVGILLAGFGSLFFWFVAIRADLSFLTFLGSSAKVAGRIVSVDVSNPSARARNRIRASHYVYSVAGRQIDGVSYATGRPVTPGDTVSVEYLLRDPSRSRIEGMRRDLYHPAAFLVTIVPLLGILLVIVSVRAGMQRNHLLRDGPIATGTVIDRVDDNGTMRLRYEYADRKGQSFSKSVAVFDKERSAKETSALILYDPADPSSADLLDGGVSGLALDDGGEFRPRPAAAALSIALPALVVSMNLVALWRHL